MKQNLKDTIEMMQDAAGIALAGAALVGLVAFMAWFIGSGATGMDMHEANQLRLQMEQQGYLAR